MAETNKVRFNEGWIGKVGTETGEGIGCLDLWVGKDGLQVRPLPTGEEVGEINMNGHFAGPSGIKYALGDGILGEDGVLFVRASFWNYQLERIKKLNVTHGMRMRIYGKFVLEKFTRKDGTTGTSVRVNVQNFVFSYNPNRGETTGTDATPVQNQTSTTATSDEQIAVPF